MSMMGIYRIQLTLTFHSFAAMFHVAHLKAIAWHSSSKNKGHYQSSLRALCTILPAQDTAQHSLIIHTNQTWDLAEYFCLNPTEQ